MADILVSYTSSDKEWAFWIGQELEKLGHTPHIHDWGSRVFDLFRSNVRKIRAQVRRGRPAGTRFTNRTVSKQSDLPVFLHGCSAAWLVRIIAGLIKSFDPTRMILCEALLRYAAFRAARCRQFGSPLTTRRSASASFSTTPSFPG